MAVDDLIAETRVKLAGLIAPLDGRAGADISQDETFGQVKAEIGRLSSLAGGAIDWHTIASSCAELLSHEGKDLRVAFFYAAARAQLDGARGLFEGLVVISELITGFWSTMGPPFDRPVARNRFCAWFDQLPIPGISDHQPTAGDADLIRALAKVSGHVEGQLAERLADHYFGMPTLRVTIRDLVWALPDG